MSTPMRRRGALSFGPLALFALIAGAEPAQAQAQAQAQEDLCADPARRCANRLSSTCLDALGAGAMPAARAEACADQIAGYRACLADVATRCADRAPSPPAAGCEAATARQLWASAERSDDCGGYGAFLEACPNQPQAVFARASRARLACDRAAAPAAPASAPAATPPDGALTGAAQSDASVAPFLGRWEGSGETVTPCPGGNPLAALLGGGEVKPVICYDVAAAEAPAGVSLKVGVTLPGLGRGCAPSKPLEARIEQGRMIYGDIGGRSVAEPVGQGLRVTVIGTCLGDPANHETIIYQMRRAR